jgi:hypothetical protein
MALAAVAALEVAAAEVAIGLHMADHGLDGGTAAELALDLAGDAPLLSGDEDAMRIGRVMSSVTLVDISALDCAAGEPFGAFDDSGKRMAVIGIAWQRLGVPGARALVVTIDALTPNSYGAPALPLPMHSTSGAWNE